MRKRGTTDLFALALLAGLPLAVPAQLSGTGDVTVTRLEEVRVVAMSPVPGSGIDIDKVPSSVQVVDMRDMNQDGRQLAVPAATAQRLGSVNLNEESGSRFQPDFVYRGFDASPISGVAEGVAVYQNGLRLNEAFGDSVNWDLIPQVAVRRITVQGNNTVFGLNALGGAVTLDMEDGFSWNGGEAQAQGGSFGAYGGSIQGGGRTGDFAFYGALNTDHEQGFRLHSVAALQQGYGDVAWRTGAVTLHLSIAGADNDIGAVGPTPIQLLQQDPRAVFTWPQAMRNDMQLVQLRGDYDVAEEWRLSGGLYYRRFTQSLIDGNTTDVLACANKSGYFCLEGAGNYPGDVLYDNAGSQVPVSVLPEGATPGEIDATHTRAATSGMTLQVLSAAPLLGLGNHLAAGLSLDIGRVRYLASGELGGIADDLKVSGGGVTIDQAFSATAQPPLEEPVGVRSLNEDTGLYLTDALDLTSALTWTLSARLNIERLGLRDDIGSSLNADHRYSHFNPGSGFTYRLSDKVTAYAGYAQSNRAPTPGELSCADPQRPCLLGAFLVSDPDLHQVVAQTIESGLRGAQDAWGGRVRWNLGVFRTDSRDDISLLATAVNGFGYYANAGNTRREGIEAGWSYRSNAWEVHFSYALLDSTFRNALTLSSNSPAADQDGNIEVHRGNRMPMAPLHRATLDTEIQLAPNLSLGGDLRFVDSQFLAGDQSNQEPRLPPYLVMNVHGAYEVGHGLRLFAEVDNLLDRTYYTYGAFAGLDGLPLQYGTLNDPRTYSPAAGRSFVAGLSLRF